MDVGMDRLANGALVRAANERFDVLVTIDKNMPHQTSLEGLSLRVVVMDVLSNRLTDFIPIETLPPGEFTVLGRDMP